MKTIKKSNSLPKHTYRSKRRVKEEYTIQQISTDDLLKLSNEVLVYISRMDVSKGIVKLQVNAKNKKSAEARKTLVKCFKEQTKKDTTTVQYLQIPADVAKYCFMSATTPVYVESKQ